MVLISPMSTMIKNVTLIKIVTYNRQIGLVPSPRLTVPRREIRHAKRDVCAVSLLLPNRISRQRLRAPLLLARGHGAEAELRRFVARVRGRARDELPRLNREDGAQREAGGAVGLGSHLITSSALPLPTQTPKDVGTSRQIASQ